MTSGFEQTSYHRHKAEYEDYAVNGKKAVIARKWLRTDTVDYWRHARMYYCVDPLLATYPGASWLTVGDGRFGRDAWYLNQHGAHAVASDISEVLLKEGKDAGLIEKYSVENAEHLSYPDNTFDFVFCKESLHHFPRPMIALYEMLRVAKVGVLLIEPHEAPTLGGVVYVLKRILKRMLIAFGFRTLLRSSDTSLFAYSNSYEASGNYVYALSKREVEKIALAVNLPAVAFKDLNDWYEKGIEDEPCDAGSKTLKKIKLEIRKADKVTRRGLSLGASIQLVTCIFKISPTQEAWERLQSAGFEVIDLPRNPHHLKNG